ncbi:MAG: hypothetical protein JW910_18325 [Anaerolineae bacterium]|nr:hypothetical protein [Anaerolineae bacterium]
MPDEQFQYEQLLMMAEHALQNQNEVFEALERKAQLSLSISSIVMGLVAVFGLEGGLFLASPGTAATIALVGSVGLYAVVFVLAYLSLAPKSWQTPGISTMDDVKMVLKMTDNKLRAAVIKKYIAAYQNNRSTLVYKTRYAQIGMILTGLIIVLVLLAAAFVVFAS